MNGKTKEQIPDELIRAFENETIRTIIIKNWPDEAFLYTVFLRLNTGSKKLSPQELRQALKPGQFLNYLDKATAESDAVKKMLNNKKADARMKDVELALRYYAFKYHITHFDGNLKDFLDNTCDELNKLWVINSEKYIEDFVNLEESITAAYMLIDNGAPFSRFENGISSRRFNRSIFELFSYYLSDDTIRSAILCNKEMFLDNFKKLNDNPKFIAAISDTTKEPEKVVTRFQLFANMLHEITKLSITTFKLIEGKICLSSIE